MADGSVVKAIPGRDERQIILEQIAVALGPLCGDLLTQPDVLEIRRNPDGKIWVERFGKEAAVEGEMAEWAARMLITTVANALKTPISRERPKVEGELPTDGSRFTGAMEPIVASPIFVIRLRARQIIELSEYVRQGIATEAQVAAIHGAVTARLNILIVGGTSSGKTTFANAILAAISDLAPDHRIISIEDTNELQCRSADQTMMRSTLETPIRDLVKLSLRMTPHRIVVGEIRDGWTALETLKAWNTGHPGGLATVHADSALSGLERIEELLGEAVVNVSPRMVAAAIGMVVCVEKTPQGRRRVREILRVQSWNASGYQTSVVEEEGSHANH